MINILLLLTGSFPPKPLKTTAHGLPKISRNLSSNGPTFGKKYKKGFLFSNIGMKQSNMGTETAKIALNVHVHLKTANQQMSRPERQVSTCFHISNRPLPFHLHLHEISKVSRLRDLVSALLSP